MTLKLNLKSIALLSALLLLGLSVVYFSTLEKETELQNTNMGSAPLIVLVYPEEMEELAAIRQVEQGAELALRQLKKTENTAQQFKASLKSIPLKNPPQLNLQFNELSRLSPLAVLSVGPGAFQAQVIALAEEKRIPLLYLNDSFCLTAASRVGAGVGEFTWGLGLPTETLIEPLLNNLATHNQFERRNPRIFFLGTDSEDNVRELEAAKATAEQLSYEQADFLLLDPRVRDYVPSLKAALDARADIIFLSLNEQGTSLALTQANAMNLSQDVILSGLSSLSFTAENNLENALYIGRYSAKFNSKENSEFLDGLSAKNQPPTSARARGYESIRIIAEAYASGNGEVNKGLPLVKLNSLLGPISFNKVNHLLSQNIFLMNGTEIVDSLGLSFKRDLKGCALP